MTARRVAVTMQDAMKICAVSRRTLYNWMAAGRVTVVRTPSGAPRFWEDELLRVHPKRRRPGPTEGKA